MITADEVSAAMPCGEAISTSPLPRVRITRQPPTQVPAAIARAHAIFTHTGMACRLLQPPYAIEREGDHAHGLLGIVGAVSQ